MTRCKEFYDKWEKAPNWCDKCPEAVRLINNYVELIAQKPTMVGISERAVRPLFKKQNSDIQEKAIVSLEKSLESKTNPLDGSILKKNERITTGDVKKLIIKIRKEEKKPKEQEKTELDGQIVCDSIENILKYLKPDSVDLFLTDPPYPKEYLPLWKILFEKALVCLKDGGMIVTYAPHIYLPEIFSMVPDGINYVWIIAQIHAGPAATYHPSKVNVRWKPILIFVKGKIGDIDYYDDILQGTGREKDSHEWQQSLGESEDLLKKFSHEGDLIVDPFLGSGTTVVAAKKLNRMFFGIDVDENAIKTTLLRLEEIK